MNRPSLSPATRVCDIDWDAWVPQQRCTLLFVIDREQERVLLIRKKRGLGGGLINGPGGRIDPGETAFDAAIRETHEELLITPRAPSHRGEIHFQFIDGLALSVAVFTSYQFEGTPQETEEAIPIWAPMDNPPFDEMWEDDRIWLPEVLGGKHVDGRAIFDKAKMIDHDFRFSQANEAWTSGG